MDMNRFENFFALVEEIVAKIIKMIEQTKAWFDATFETEDPTNAEETTAA